MSATDGTVSFSIETKVDATGIDKAVEKVSSLDKLINSINKVEMTINFSAATLASFKGIEDNIKKMSDGFEALGKDYSKAMLEGAKMARIEMETQGKLQIEKEKQKTQELVGINKAASNSIVANAIETADKINEANKKVKAPTFDLDANKAIIDLKNSFALQKQALESGNKELYTAQSEGIQKILDLIPESNKKSILMYRQNATLKLVESKRAMQLEIEAEAEKNKKIVAAADEGKKIIAAKDAEAARNKEAQIKKENDAEVKAYNSLVKGIEEAYAKRNAIALQAFANEMELGKKRIAEAKRVEAEIAKTAEETQKKTWAQAGMMLGSSKSTAPIPTAFSGMPAGLSQNQKVDATGMLLGNIKPSTATPSANQALPSGFSLLSDLQKKAIDDANKSYTTYNEAVKRIFTEYNRLVLDAQQRTNEQRVANATRTEQEIIRITNQSVQEQTNLMRRLSEQNPRTNMIAGMSLAGRQAANQQPIPQINTTGTTNALTALTGALNQVQKAFLAIGIVMSARTVMNYADDWVHFTNAVAMSTEKTGHAVEMQQRLFKLAQDNRTPLDAVTSVYLRMSRAAETLNISQAETVKMIDVVTKSLAIMGTAPTAVRGGLLQLEQALGGVTVRGQEFKSILDSQPLLMQVIANHYKEAARDLKVQQLELQGARKAQIDAAKSADINGMSIRELSNLMRDRKMTAEATSKAIVLGQTEINEKYKLSQKTFEQAFTVFNNGLTKYVGTLNAATGTSNMFFNAMKGLSENIDLMVAGMIGLGAAMLTFALNTERAAAAGALMARTPAGFAIGALAMGATYSISKSQSEEAAKSEEQKIISRIKNINDTITKYSEQNPIGKKAMESLGMYNKTTLESEKDALEKQLKTLREAKSEAETLETEAKRRGISQQALEYEKLSTAASDAFSKITAKTDKYDEANEKAIKSLELYRKGLESIASSKALTTEMKAKLPATGTEEYFSKIEEMLGSDKVKKYKEEAEQAASKIIQGALDKKNAEAAKTALEDAQVKLEQFDVQIKDLQSKISTQLQSAFIKNPIKIAFEMDETKFEKPAAQFKSLIEKSAKSSGVPANLIASVIQTESHWNPNAVSETGVKGLAQFTKPTGSYYGISPTDRTNVEKNIDAAGRYLADLIKRFGGNLEKAVTAYNGGGDKQYASKVLGLYGKQSTSESPEMISTQQQLNTVMAARDKLADAIKNKNGTLVIQAKEQLELELRKTSELDKEYARQQQLNQEQISNNKKAIELIDKQTEAEYKYAKAYDSVIERQSISAKATELAASKGAFAIPEIESMLKKITNDQIALSKEKATALDTLDKSIAQAASERNDVTMAAEKQAKLNVLELDDKQLALEKEINDVARERKALLEAQVKVIPDLIKGNSDLLEKLTSTTGELEKQKAIRAAGATGQEAQRIRDLIDEKELLLGLNTIKDTVTSSISSGFSQMFQDIILNGKSAADALAATFKSMLSKIMSAIMDFMAQQLVQKMFGLFSGSSLGGGLFGGIGGTVTAIAGAVAIGTYMGMQKTVSENTNQLSMTSKYPNGIPENALAMQSIDKAVSSMNFLVTSQEATRYNKDLRETIGKVYGVVYTQSDKIGSFVKGALEEYFPETMSAIRGAFVSVKDAIKPLTDSIGNGFTTLTKYFGLGTEVASASTTTLAYGTSTLASDAVSQAAAQTAVGKLSTAIDKAITPAFQSTTTEVAKLGETATKSSSSLLSTIGFVASLGIEAFSLASSWGQLNGAFAKTLAVVDAIGNVAFSYAIAFNLNPIALAIASVATAISIVGNVIKDGFTPMNISRMVGAIAGAVIGTMILPGIGTMLGFVLGDMFGKLIGSLFEKQKKIDFGILVNKKQDYGNIESPTVDKVSKENRVLAMSTNMGDVYYGRTQGLNYAITKQEKEFVTGIANTLQSIGNVVGNVDKAIGNTEDYTRNIFRNIVNVMRRVEASSFDATKSTSWFFTSIVKNLQKTNTDAGKEIGGWLSVFITAFPKEYSATIIDALTQNKELYNSKTKAIQTTSVLEKLVLEAPIGVLGFVQSRLESMVKKGKTVQQVTDETFQIISDSSAGLSVVNEEFIKFGIVLDATVTKLNAAANATSDFSSSITGRPDVTNTANLVESIIKKYDLNAVISMQFVSKLGDIIHSAFMASGSEAATIQKQIESGKIDVSKIPSSLTKYPTMDELKKYGTSDISGNIYQYTTDAMVASISKATTGIAAKSWKTIEGKGFQLATPAAESIYNPVQSNAKILADYFSKNPSLSEAQLNTIANTNFITSNYKDKTSIDSSLKSKTGALPTELGYFSQDWMQLSPKDKSYMTNASDMTTVVKTFVDEYKRENSLINGMWTHTNAVANEQTKMMTKAIDSLDVFITSNKLTGKSDIIGTLGLASSSIMKTGIDYGVAATWDLTKAATVVTSVANKNSLEAKKALDDAKNALVVANQGKDKASIKSAQATLNKEQMNYDANYVLELQKATQEIQNNMGLIFEMFVDAGSKLSDVVSDDFAQKAQDFVTALGGIDKAVSAVDKAKKYALTDEEYSKMKVDVAQTRVDALLKQTSFKTIEEATTAFKNNPLDATLVTLMGSASDLSEALKTASTTANGFKKSISDWVLGKMTTTVGSPESQFKASKDAFESTLSILNNPNASKIQIADAQSKITGYADTFITNIQKMYGAGDLGANMVQDVVNKVSNLGGVDYQTTMLEKTTQIADNTAKMVDNASSSLTTADTTTPKAIVAELSPVWEKVTVGDMPTVKSAANDSNTDTTAYIAELKLSNEQLAQLVVETRALVNVQVESNQTVVAQLTDLTSSSKGIEQSNRIQALAA